MASPAASGELLLRPACVEDAAAIAQVYLASRKALLPYAPLAHADEAVHAWVRHSLLAAGPLTVAEQRGAVLGFVASARVDGVRWIEQLYLLPHCLGRGLGAALLGTALAGPEELTRLYTFQANTRARRFYERFGFVAVAFSDGSTNEERCPDVLYERPVGADAAARTLAGAPPHTAEPDSP